MPAVIGGMAKNGGCLRVCSKSCRIGAGLFVKFFAAGIVGRGCVIVRRVRWGLIDGLRGGFFGVRAAGQGGDGIE